MTDALSNAAEFTVSEISFALKRSVEDQFGFVRVRGEISGYRGPHSSGHAYFALKDEGARIEAVVWRGVMGKLRFKPEEGMEVIATGRLTTYPNSSKYQIVIDALEPAGAGALMALLEERKRKLGAEGLFDPGRKQLLPYLPRVVGVVTSPTGAVIRDILHRLADRFPVHVLVWPVKVQGENCGPEVAAGIAGFNALPEGGSIPRPDVIIVARGGGSLEDLWGFNDEVVVRAAAASDIPLVSAVGQAVQDVADDGAGRRGDDADDTRQIGRELLATGLEQPLGGELALALFEQRHQCAGPGWLQRVDDDLVLGGVGVGGDLATGDHLHAFFRLEAQLAEHAAPDHRLDAGVLVLQRKVGVTGRVRTAIAGDLAAHPHEPELVFHRPLESEGDIGHRIVGRIRRRVGHVGFTLHEGDSDDGAAAIIAAAVGAVNFTGSRDRRSESSRRR